MRSFRLDSDSVSQFLRNPLPILICVLAAAAFVYFGGDIWYTRILAPVLLAVGGGPMLFDGTIQERYPTASHVWMLSIGMSAILAGVALRMAFPAWQASSLDLTWLGVAFFSILFFVLLNHGNKEVFK